MSSREEHAAWHSKRLATLGAEDGWLTLVGLDFLAEGAHSIGSAPEATFRYANCAEPIVGTIDVSGEISAERVRFVPSAGPPRDLVADDRGEPSVIRSGPVSFTLVRRNGRLALRVRDNASTVRTGFKGIDLFPFDPAFVVAATAEAPRAGEMVPIINILGFEERQPVAARLRFELGGSEHTLVATPGAGGRLFVVFADTTTGRQTYGGGRFLDVPPPIDGRTVIDFNRATNPPCSFTAYATCPLPPAGNRLPVAVMAGERAPISPAK